MGWGTSRKFTYREKVLRGRRLGCTPTSGGTLENTEKRQSPGGRPRAGSPSWPQRIWGFPASRKGTPTFPLCQGAHCAPSVPAAREKLIGALIFLVGAGAVRTGALTDVWAWRVFSVSRGSQKVSSSTPKASSSCWDKSLPGPGRIPQPDWASRVQ